MPIDNAAPSNVHGVQENTSGTRGLCVLYSVGETHFRARLRPVNPLGAETFDRGDAYTLFEWSEVEKPAEDATTVERFDLSHVPRVVRDEVPVVVQVPDAGGRNV